MLPRRITGVTARQQRRLAMAIECARMLGWRPYVPAYTDLLLHDRGPELADGVPAGRGETATAWEQARRARASTALRSL